MNNKLIADSGSTKTDWAVIRSSSETDIYTTIGFNPSLASKLPTLKSLNNSLHSNAKTCTSAIYYGAGVIDESKRQIIRDWLFDQYPSLITIEVYSDLLGVCKATAKNSPAIVSILGTGSNSCVYDGQKITENVPSLGYSLGNEGAGTEIGKAILKAFFYNTMPKSVQTEFNSTYSVDKTAVVDALYKGDNPTQFLSRFASFINETTAKSWRSKILTSAFREFIEVRILPYSDYLSYELHFVGSIAYFCQDILIEVLEEYNLQSKSIVQKPIQGLIDFHK